MTEPHLVGRCGLYCGACVIYRAYKDNGKYHAELARKIKCRPEKLRCEGCQVLTQECWGNNCEIVQCLKSKGFSFCYECPQFHDKSCGKLEKLAGRYLEVGEDIRANLARIRSGQTEAWLRENKQRFKCPYCGKPLPVGSQECYHCERKFSRLLKLV